jgi:hypothetical protein
MNKRINNDNSDTQSLLISYLTIRKSVGMLAVFLPVVLVIGTIIIGKCCNIQDSISDYYYTVMGNYFVGTLCAVALFLFSYNGYDKQDRLSSILACIFALGIAFFPTSMSDPESLCNINSRNSSSFISTIHYTSAGLFFIDLAYISFWLFTKSSGNYTPQKIKRNKVYKLCGYLIVLSIVLIALYHIPFIHSEFQKYKPVIYLETIALWAFGFSWLTKGEFLLKDEKADKKGEYKNETQG